jgi:hypothetical protein
LENALRGGPGIIAPARLIIFSIGAGGEPPLAASVSADRILKHPGTYERILDCG